LSEPISSFSPFPETAVGDGAVAPAQLPFLRGLIGTHGALAMQFLRFGVVGTVGFLVDTAVVYATHQWLGLIGAGILSFFVAATGNWFLNRSWTFRGMGRGRLHHEWMRFLGANAFGFVLNRGAYIALIATVPLCSAYPVLAVAAGSIAGLGVNFTLSRRIVFR
jgi:putative flippase GtrA